MRRLYTSGSTRGWDDDIANDEKKTWSTWFRELLKQPEIRFPRSTKPEDAQGQPRLVGFCDALDQAVCAVLYVVWMRCQGQPTSRLLIGKCRVTPLLGTMIPRGELQSLVITHRLAQVVAEGFLSRFASISMYTDSMSSIGAMAKSGSVLRPFFANSVGGEEDQTDNLTCRGCISVKSLMKFGIECRKEELFSLFLHSSTPDQLPESS